jgi:hypothetical protein
MNRAVSICRHVWSLPRTDLVKRICKGENDAARKRLASPALFCHVNGMKGIEAMRSTFHFSSVVIVAHTVFALSGCSRGENEAKERLFSPAPPDPMIAAAKEVIPVFELATNKDAWTRVNRMPYDEMRRRLDSFTYKSEGTLDFSRQKLQLRSTERVTITQPSGDDFSIALSTGDGSTQDIVFANDVLFLKNNNGHWRASRDPKGERTELIDDSAGVWRSFFDLFAHALVVERKDGLTTRAGREAIVYTLTVRDESAKAAAKGREETALPDDIPFAADEEGVDGGVAPGKKLSQKDVTDRISRWRQNAHPAGGKGEVVVDSKTGVVLAVRFTGALAVGDAPSTGRLDVDVTVGVSDIGADLQVSPPKGAIEEITRKKWPTDPRTDLEKKGIVPPLPPAEPASPSKTAPSSGEGAKAPTP